MVVVGEQRLCSVVHRDLRPRDAYHGSLPPRHRRLHALEKSLAAGRGAALLHVVAQSRVRIERVVGPCRQLTVRPCQLPLEALPHIGLVPLRVILHVGWYVHLPRELTEESHGELLVRVNPAAQRRVGRRRRVAVGHLQQLLHRHLHIALLDREHGGEHLCVVVREHGLELADCPLCLGRHRHRWRRWRRRWRVFGLLLAACD
mmetsp:Transcript_1268/g.2505  ORF Transcript_1268/g.2505 Transcript_1268/m.2505 type:complete len:203 (-) Transcript_1268:117-725(-)